MQGDWNMLNKAFEEQSEEPQEELAPAEKASPPPGLGSFTPAGWMKYFEALWYAAFDLWLEEQVKGKQE